MADEQKLKPEEHRKQVEAYTAIRHQYETYAKAMRRVLEDACRASFPEAFVQARAKDVSSFAEKAARKHKEYPDAVNQMNDLCGARVIVQTIEQVRAVRGFIEAKFDIVESEDKGLLLSLDKFGYRDMHYIVRLKQEHARAIGFSETEIDEIGGKRAEVQVRTWLQHAWADTLHDRMYKNKLTLPDETKRTGALLAALMEEGDRNFNVLADDLDGLIANYTSFATVQEVADEIELQRVIFRNEDPQGKNRPTLALKLARLAAATGDHAGVVECLRAFEGTDHGLRCEILLELGYHLCALHRGQADSAEYLRGKAMVEEAAGICACRTPSHVPNPRKRESLHARALYRLGWICTRVPHQGRKARECYREAHKHEPDNPYYLAAMLGVEVHFDRSKGMLESMAATIGQAIDACRAHATANIELPYAYFTAARLCLLARRGDEALGYYARGLRHCLAGTHCVPSDAVAEEVEWIHHLHSGDEVPAESQRAIDLLTLGQRASKAPSSGETSVMLVAGGADSLPEELAKEIRPLLEFACEGFEGTIISGGTTAGVPGCLGDAAGALAGAGKKRFRLIAYRPERLPDGVNPHPQYDKHITLGVVFQPEQVLRSWSDLLDAGIGPSQVQLLGFGGGKLSAIEYCIALGLGASVGLVADTDGSAKRQLEDPLWTGVPNLHELPLDKATIRAFVVPADHRLPEADQGRMARAFHENYVSNSPGKLPANMRPWEKLAGTFRRANLEQAKYSIEILEAAGFEVVKVEGNVALANVEDKVEEMAELEHGRWNVERLMDGWRYSAKRDDTKKLHDCLVPWSKLPDGTKLYDYESVRAFPRILAMAGLEVREKRRVP